MTASFAMSSDTNRIVAALQQLSDRVAELTRQLASTPVTEMEASGEELEGLLTYAEVAAQLQVTENWVRDAARAGTIPRRQLGRVYRFTQEDVDEFVASTYRVGRDPFARTARQFAAMNRRTTSR